MSKSYVKAETLFLIGCFFKDQIYYLSNPSSITNSVILDKDLHYSKINNFLFYIENEFKHELQYPKMFYSPLVFKHKYSNKFLNFAEERGEQSYEGNQLCLSHTLVKWSALPCYKYQVKNTQNIEFGSRVYITQEDFKQASLKSLFIKEHIYQQNRPPLHQILFGFNLKSQIILIKYHHREDYNFHFGQMLKIYHQESYSFLVDSTPIQKIYNLQENEQSAQKNLICFKNENEDIGETQLDCIWMLQEAKSIKVQQLINGTLFINSEIKIKHLLTGKYLTLKDNSIDDQSFEIVGEQHQTIYSNFQIEPVRAVDKLVGNDTQLRLKHVKIYQYMAVSKVRESHTLIEIIMDKMAQDEHFYQLKRIPFQYQLTVFFLINVKKQLMRIKRIFYQSLPSLQTLQEISKIYSNLHVDLLVIEKLESSEKILKSQLTHFIPLIVRIISSLQEMQSSNNRIYELVKEIKKHNYIFLIKIIKGHSINQLQAYQSIHIYIKDLFEDLYVEQFLIQIFRNNMKILSKISIKNSYLEENIVTAIFNNIKKDQKDQIYWSKMLKVLDLLGCLIKIHDQYIDINQRLIVLQLFGHKKAFDQLLFQIKFRNSQLFVRHPTRQSNMLINNIKDPAAIQLITKIFSFISSLCEGRNIISKKLIDAYLNVQDKQGEIKTIINCFYIRNDKVLRGKVLMLLANLYLDSFPRVAKYRPINILKMNVQGRKIAQVHNAASQIAELSNKLRESLVIRAESSHQTKPLSRINNILNEQSLQTKKEPSYTAQEVNEFKQVIILLVQTQKWNLEILKIVKMMLSLSLLSSTQKNSIFKNIFCSIEQYISDKIIMKEIILILELIVRQLQQQMLLKVNLYFIYIYYKQKEEIDKDDCQFVFYNNKKILFPREAKISETDRQLMSEYHNVSQKINSYYKDISYFEALLNFFLKNQYDSETMMKYLDISQKFYRPGKQITELLASTLVLSEHDLLQYEQLLIYAHQIKNLAETSEEWLCNTDQQAEDYKKFCKLLTQVNNFMYDNYILDSQDGKAYRKKNKLNKNRQIMMKNIGFYTYLFNLLRGNYYLLEGESLKTLSRKIRLSFEKCFQFLYDFCFQCEENKEIMSRQMQVIKLFANLLQTGQTNLWILLIRNNKKIIQETTQQDFQNLIFKIVKNRTSSSYANCDYNPLYIDQIMVLLDINHQPYMPNVFKIAKILKQTILFRKMMYLKEESDKKNMFCLDLFKFRMDPTQIPVIYQTRLINFLLYIIKALGSKDTSVKRSLKNIITLEYLFQLLVVEDSFTHDGIPADMNFLFKKQLLKLLELYLSIKSIDNEVFSSVTITKFLKFYKHIYTQNFLKKESTVDNQMLYFPYTQKQEQNIIFFIVNNKAFYLKYLRKILIRLNDIFSKIHHKQLDDNYQLITVLLNQQNLIKMNKKGEQKDLTLKIDRKIITKWSQLLPMSEKSPKHETTTKRLLYRLLTNEEYKKLYDLERQKFFEAIQSYEDDFINRILSISKSILNKFQDFHQHPLSELLFTFSQYIEYKINKKQQLFTGNLIKPKLSDSFTILIIPFFQLICLSNFDYKKNYCRKIFHYALVCINKILSLKKQFEVHQNILDFLLNELNSGDRFLDALKQALLEIIEEEPVESSIQEIDTSQNLMFLLGEQQKIQPLLPSLILIRQLCRYTIFTEYFRNQQNTGSIDFLQIIYKNLMTVLQRRDKVINIVVVERIQYLSECITSFFTGVNKVNQQFIIKKDFIKEIQYILKIFTFKEDEQRNESTKSKINQISKSYGYCLPFYGQVLTQEWNFFTFNHFFVINTLKTSLIKIILGSVIANNNTLQTIRAIMSLELLKLNIIILYEENSVSDQQIKQIFFIDQFINWRSIFKNKDKYCNSYSLITYGLFLIRLFQEDLGHIDDPAEPISIYSETLKQKTYEEYLPKEIQLLLKQMKDEPFFKNIRLFYEKFFEAYQYFIKKMIQVEVVLQNGQITLVLFPQLPLCSKLTNDMLQEMKQQSNRTNQQQKNKSLLIYSEQFYEQIQGQIDYNDLLESSIRYGNHLVTLLSYNSLIYISICVISIIITVLYIIQNYFYFQAVTPPLDLTSQLTKYFSIYTSGIQAIEIIFKIVSLSLGLILGLFLIIKKIPLYFSIHKKSFHKLAKKQRIGVSKSQFTHAISKLFGSVSLELFLAIFASLSIIHPFFSGFVLLYIVSRLFMGKIIIKMLKLSWFQILIVIAVIIAFNFFFTMIVYIQLTNEVGYGPVCTSTMSCFKMIMNMILKGGFVVWNPSSYTEQRLDFKNLVEISHQIFIVGIIMNIFGGLIIDTISLLREKSANVQIDEENICFICGQTQLAIDLELEGYKKHKEKIHNPQYYINFIFYLKRKKNNKYIFYEDYVSNEIFKQSYTWIPSETSLKHRKLHPLHQNVQFKDKYLDSLNQNNGQIRRTLYNTIKLENKLKQALHIEDNQYFHSESLLKLPSPNKSKISSNKSFRSFQK